MSAPTIPEIISEAHEGISTLLADIRDVAETLAARVALAESRERGMREGLEEAMRAHRSVCEEAARLRAELGEAIARAETAERERDEVRGRLTGGATEGAERSCFTCHYNGADNACGQPDYVRGDTRGLGLDVANYGDESGAADAIDLMPTDRTIRCPGWAAKETK